MKRLQSNAQSSFHILCYMRCPSSRGPRTVKNTAQSEVQLLRLLKGLVSRPDGGLKDRQIVKLAIVIKMALMETTRIAVGLTNPTRRRTSLTTQHHESPKHRQWKDLRYNGSGQEMPLSFLILSMGRPSLVGVLFFRREPPRVHPLLLRRPPPRPIIFLLLLIVPMPTGVILGRRAGPSY